MSNKRIGAKNFGDIYVEGKRYRSRREWRGVVDTLYDYSRWLYNWINMFRIVLVKPRNIKAMFRYRWMHLRICHAEQDVIIEDVAKLLDKLFRGDRRIGNDEEFSKKVVLVDENEMQSVMMGFPAVVPLSREIASTYIPVLLNQRAAIHYIDVAQEYGLAGDVCPMLKPAFRSMTMRPSSAAARFSATPPATARCSATALSPSAWSLRTVSPCSSSHRRCAI